LKEIGVWNVNLISSLSRLTFQTIADRRPNAKLHQDVGIQFIVCIRKQLTLTTHLYAHAVTAEYIGEMVKCQSLFNIRARENAIYIYVSTLRDTYLEGEKNFKKERNISETIDEK
jgi:hypothetical protein